MKLTPEEQYFNLMNGLADSVMDASDEEVETWIVEPVENRCSYLCGPHLEQCSKSKRHHRNKSACVCERGVACVVLQVLEERKRLDPDAPDAISFPI